MYKSGYLRTHFTFVLDVKHLSESILFLFVVNLSYHGSLHDRLVARQERLRKFFKSENYFGEIIAKVVVGDADLD